MGRVVVRRRRLTVDNSTDHTVSVALSSFVAEETVALSAHGERPDKAVIAIIFKDYFFEELSRFAFCDSLTLKRVAVAFPAHVVLATPTPRDCRLVAFID